MRPALLALVVVLVPAAAAAQLEPRQHSFAPLAGASFATGDLLNATAEMPFPQTPADEVNPVSLTISLDPGVFTGLRYAYNVNRRLALEGEFSAGISVFVMQALEHFPPDNERANAPEPQFETTTMDARIYQYFFNFSYYFATWGVANPFFTAGIGSRTTDLRQKGRLNLDSIHDRSYMAGVGLNFNVNDRLRIRFDVRDFMYNFKFDNQFAGRGSDQIHCPLEITSPSDPNNPIVSCRDVGVATATANPSFQNDIVVNLGFLMRAF